MRLNLRAETEYVAGYSSLEVVASLLFFFQNFAPLYFHLVILPTLLSQVVFRVLMALGVVI